MHYFGQLGCDIKIYRNDEHNAQKILNSKPEAIILSPGPCDPAKAGICVPLIQQSMGKIPILGVCLGHQSIGYAFGAKIVRAPVPVHGKVKKVRHTGHDLFKNIPNEFSVTRYHSLIVDENTVPDCLNVIATSAESSEENIIMGLAHKEYPIWGVQFHPESIRTQDGMHIIQNFLDLT